MLLTLWIFTSAAISNHARGVSGEFIFQLSGKDARRDSRWLLVPFDRQTRLGEDVSPDVLYSDVGKARVKLRIVKLLLPNIGACNDL